MRMRLSRKTFQVVSTGAETRSSRFGFGVVGWIEASSRVSQVCARRSRSAQFGRGEACEQIRRKAISVGHQRRVGTRCFHQGSGRVTNFLWDGDPQNW